MYIDPDTKASEIRIIYIFVCRNMKGLALLEEEDTQRGTHDRLLKSLSLQAFMLLESLVQQITHSPALLFR